MSDELSFANCSHSKDPLVGCALEGVAGVLAGVRDSSVVIHSPQGCSSTLALGYDAQEVDFTRRKTACTRLFETDIIMGATDKLKDLILQCDARFASKVCFVVGTCAADIIGEDLEGVCRQLQPKVRAQLVPIFAGGFRGNLYDGIDLGLTALAGLMKPRPERPSPRSVNLIAPQASQNPSWRADLAWVRQVLGEFGVSVQSVLTRDSSMHELRHASSAEANLLLSHDAGQALAARMQRDFGTEWILSDIALPIGLGNTARWLRALAARFEARARAEELISLGEKRVADVLRRRSLMLIPRYRNCKVAVSADASFGIGLLRLLFEELEMLPELVLIRSGNPAARELMARELEELGISPRIGWNVDGFMLKQSLAQSEVHAVWGSAYEKYLAEEVGIKIAFDVLTPTNREIYLDRAYFGYEGMLGLLEVVANDWERAMRSKRIAFEQYADRQSEEACRTENPCNP